MAEKEISALSGKRPPRIYYGYLVVLAGVIVWMVGWGSYGTFGIFFKHVSDEFEVGRAGTATAYAFCSIVIGLLGLVAGWLTDRIGPRRVVLIFGSFLGLGYLAMSLVREMWQFDLIYGLGLGIGLSVVNIPVMTTVSRWFAKRKGLMLGVVQAGVGVGGIIFPLLVAGLIPGHGWRFAFFVLGLISLAAFIVAGLLLRRDPAEMGLKPYGLEAGPAVQEKPNPANPGPRVSFSDLISTRIFWMLAGLFFCFGLARCLVLVHIAPHVTDSGFTLEMAATVLVIMNVSSIFGRIGMGRAADAIGSRQAFIISYAATAVILLWALAAHSLWGFYLFAAVFGFGWGAQAVLRFKVAGEEFAGRSLGLSTGIIYQGETIGSVLGAVLSGYIFDVVGSYQPAFIMGAAVSIAGIILTWRLRRR